MRTIAHLFRIHKRLAKNTMMPNVACLQNKMNGMETKLKKKTESPSVYNIAMCFETHSRVV